jgi:hypothetical protein
MLEYRAEQALALRMFHSAGDLAGVAAEATV